MNYVLVYSWWRLGDRPVAGPFDEEARAIKLARGLREETGNKYRLLIFDDDGKYVKTSKEL